MWYTLPKSSLPFLAAECDVGWRQSLTKGLTKGWSGPPVGVVE